MSDIKLGVDGSEVTLPASVSISQPVDDARQISIKTMIDGSKRPAFYSRKKVWELTWVKLTKTQLESLKTLRGKSQALNFQNDYYEEYTDLCSSDYKWSSSGSGMNEYYLEASGGGDPSVSEPADVLENKSLMTAGTLGSLSSGEWGYGDNDSLGYTTVYVRLSDGADPDSKASEYVEAIPSWYIVIMTDFTFDTVDPLSSTKYYKASMRLEEI